MWVYDYTGGEQTFTVPINGTYKLEAWGAQGGTSSRSGGYGGYAYGNVNLIKNLSMYIVVGGQGYCTTGGSSLGGYNGGGAACSINNNYTMCSGGGASHISTTNKGILVNFNSYQDEVLIVAGVVVAQDNMVVKEVQVELAEEQVVQFQQTIALIVVAEVVVLIHMNGVVMVDRDISTLIT